MFGTYRFSYTPGTDSRCSDSSFTMSFSGGAGLPEIISHFENFLRASGYPLDFQQELVISTPSFNGKSLSEAYTDKVQEIVRELDVPEIKGKSR